MFNDPVEECSFESNVVTGLLAFNPFMAQYLFALGQELLVEHRIFHQLCGVFFRGFHLLYGEFQHLAYVVNQNYVNALTVVLKICHLPVGNSIFLRN
jgi:hypothetical protein